jgi:S1-C subfamily serine protease
VIGLRMQSYSVPRMGVSLRPEEDGGVRVMEIVPGSPAAAAGIKGGDVIVSVNERPAMDVFFAGGFGAMYGTKPAGTQIPVVVKRDNATVNVPVALRFGPAPPTLVEDPAASPRAVRLRNGLLHGTTDK